MKEGDYKNKTLVYERRGKYRTLRKSVYIHCLSTGCR